MSAKEGQQNFMPIPPKPYQPDTPSICGEGEIVPVHYQDGSVQFYFLPKTYYTQFNPFKCCNQTSPPNNNGAWLISSISQPVNYLNLQPPQIPTYTQQNIFFPPYQLKFHRDSCTSTTDLHYFVPRPTTIRIRRVESAVQATQPRKIGSLTANNKIIDINIPAPKNLKNKAKKRASSSCACAEAPQKLKSESHPSSVYSAEMSTSSESEIHSSEDSESDDASSCDEVCNCGENNTKTLSKTQKSKAKTVNKKKKPPQNKCVMFTKASDCSCSSDEDMTEGDYNKKEGTKQAGRSEYYSFVRKRF